MHRLTHMDEALARAQALVDDYARELFATLPEGSEIFDAHVHLGHDIDGFSGSYDDLMSVNDRYRISRCFTPRIFAVFAFAGARTMRCERESLVHVTSGARARPRSLA